MDATGDVTPRERTEGAAARGVYEGEGFRSAEAIREEISLTSQALHDRLDELRGRLYSRFGSFSNPLHVRERIQARPLAACGVALLVGVVLGARRGFSGPVVAFRGVGRASSRVVRGVGQTVGAQVTSAVLSRFLGGGR
jgi:hypothetical protein